MPLRRIAFLGLGDVAVVVLLLEPAIVGDAGERQRRGGFDRAVERQHRHSLSVVCGEVKVRFQPRSSSCTGAAAVTPTWLSAPVKFKWNSTPSSLTPMSAYMRLISASEKSRKPSSWMPSTATNAPQVPLRAPAASEPWHVSERAEAAVDLGALEVEAVAHDDADRAADGVEAEDRIGADDGDAGDGVVGQEVPVDDVAERLVDAHAVLIDGEALRHAVDGRGFEAAVLQIALKHVALRVAEDDARHSVLQHLRKRSIAERAMSAAEARPTAAGNLPIGISLPGRGDIFTVPLSMPPVPAIVASTAARARPAAAAARGRRPASSSARFSSARPWAPAAAFFWMTSTAGSSDAAGGAGVGGAAAPESCAMAGADDRQARHNTDANADAKRIE